MVGHRERGRRAPAVILLDVPRGPARRCRGMSPVVGVQDDPVREYSNASSAARSAASASASSAQRIVGVRREDDRVEPVVAARRPSGCERRLAVVERRPRPGRPARTASGPSTSRGSARRRSMEPPRDRAPLERTADTDQPVVVEEAQEGSRSGNRRTRVAPVDQTADVIGIRKWSRKPRPKPRSSR